VYRRWATGGCTGGGNELGSCVPVSWNIRPHRTRRARARLLYIGRSRWQRRPTADGLMCSVGIEASVTSSVTPGEWGGAGGGVISQCVQLSRPP